jgi:hypothetical protein
MSDLCLGEKDTRPKSWDMENGERTSNLNAQKHILRNSGYLDPWAVGLDSANQRTCQWVRRAFGCIMHVSSFMMSPLAQRKPIAETGDEGTVEEI